jgi:2-polyprenyl-3-methyl-5-hydroxy-6-metoxy-1,4-benzoquinol methylase
MYLRKNFKYLADRIGFIKGLCLEKEVLNLGCADVTRVDIAPKKGQHLHVEISKVSRRLVGIDISQEALDKLKSINDFELICWDVERIGELTNIGKFDVVVCGELIEHLSNPGQMLDGIRKLLKRGGLLIITTPNAFSLKHFLHVLIRSQDINSDFHSLAFTPKTLRTLLHRHGFLDVAWHGSTWELPSLRNYLFRILFYPLFVIFPYLSDTLICVAKQRGDES